VRQLRRHTADASALDDILRVLDAPGSTRYALRKHATLRNLYGVDLMPEAIEIAKLRLFLSLAATLEDRDEVRALPDLDFNLKAGNLLLGFRDLHDAEERYGTIDLMVAAEVQELAARGGELRELRRDFVATQERDEDAGPLKRELARVSAEVAAQADAVLERTASADLEGHRPLHWFVAFPDVIDDGGFDVVIGNPPYIAMREIEYPLTGYTTASAHDVYLPCMERSIRLAREGGSFSMVVPHSICFRPGASNVVRELLARRFGQVAASSYAKRPDSLFSGVQVRNAIVVATPGAHGRTLMSRHMVWPSAARYWMLRSLRYTQLPEIGEWPRVPAQSIADALLPAPPLGRARRSGSHELYFRRTSQYWVPVLADQVPIYTPDLIRQDNPHLSMLYFDSSEERLVALGVLAGKLGYLWWSMFGDDFNVTSETLHEAVAAVARNLRPSRDLLALLHELDDEMQSPERRMWTMNRYWVGNVDLLGLRPLTDQVDRVLLAETGRDPRVWEDIQIWYRQAMRAGRRANNAVFAAEPPGAAHRVP
jgi:Eco57I restriction-modification methylase